MKKLAIFALSIFTLLGVFAMSASAFEFGYMGNTSFAMGGSGVGNANSAWGLYYNPALQGVDNNFKVGYSLGMRVRESGLSELKNFDLGKLNGNIDTVNKVLKNNEIALTSENGIVLQAPLSLGSVFSHSIAAGIFYTKRNIANVSGHLQSSGSNIDSANNAYLVNNNLDILEVPISYTMQVYMGGFGTFYAGVALKYIYATHSANKTKMTQHTDFGAPFRDIFRIPNGARTHNFGIDVGLAYSLPNEWLVIGIVGKNLTSPTIKTQNLTGTNGALTDSAKLKMDAQYRLGLSTRAIPRTTFAMDFDLVPNYEFSGFNTRIDTNAVIARKKVQYISLGAMVDAKILDVRVGVAKNIAESSSKDGWLLSAGIGMGYIDLVLFTGTKMSKAIKNLPAEFGIKLGGSVSF